MPFLTASEMAAIRDHLGWDNSSVHSNYVQTFVNPRLEQDMTAEELVRIRGHLTKLEILYDLLGTVPEDFGLDEAKGIKFSRFAEGRMLSMYAMWQGKLATALTLNINVQPQAVSSDQRIIL